MPNREFTVDNFKFASSEISPTQDLLIASFSSLIFTGDTTMPPFPRVDDVEVIGHAKGTNPDNHAVMRGFRVKERLIDHLEAFDKSIDWDDKIRLGMPVADKQPNGKGVTGEDRKAVIRVSWTKPKPKKKRKVQPLTRKQIKLFVWAVMGKTPKSVAPSNSKMAKEFAEFTGIQNFLKKPSVVSGTKAFFKTYVNVMTATFSLNKQHKLGVMVGAAYSMMDAATELKKTRAKPLHNSKKTKAFAEGFMEGYGMMAAHLAIMGDDELLRTLLKRLNAASPRTRAMSHIYSAIFEITVPELGGADLIYISARERGRFGYPRFKVNLSL